MSAAPARPIPCRTRARRTRPHPATPFPARTPAPLPFGEAR